MATTAITLEAAVALADEHGWPLPSLPVLARHIEEYHLTTKDSRWFAESASRFHAIQDCFSAYFDLEVAKTVNDVDQHLLRVSELQSRIIVHELECAHSLCSKA